VDTFNHTTRLALEENGYISPTNQEDPLDNHILLSTEGSDRGTAYNISGKIVRRGHRLFVGWLDAAAARGGAARIRLGVCDVETGELIRTLTLGEGVDNHCGPAIALDGNGRLHALVGAHHGDFLYRWSDDPEDQTTWSDPEPVGPHHSYPALAIDAQGTLHLAYREKGERWQLQYTRKHPDGVWQPPVVIAESPVPGYNHFMHSLTVGEGTGNLHLTFQFHYDESGNARQCKGKAAVYVSSADGGDSWTNEGESCELPLKVDSARPFASCLDNPEHSLRIGTHVVDAEGHPWLFCSLPDPPRGVIWRHTDRLADQSWSEIDLAGISPQLDTSGGKSTAISRDAQGRIHLLVGTHPGGSPTGWYDPAMELFHITLEKDGSAACTPRQLTDNDPERARWLPSIEPWDWTRPDDIATDGHWFTYTSGVAAGMLSDPNYDHSLKTEVYLGKL